MAQPVRDIIRGSIIPWLRTLAEKTETTLDDAGVQAFSQVVESDAGWEWLAGLLGLTPGQHGLMAAAACDPSCLPDECPAELVEVFGAENVGRDWTLLKQLLPIILPLLLKLFFRQPANEPS